MMRNPSSELSTARVMGKKPTTATKTTPCCSKEGLNRGPWTPAEDEILVNYIKKEGEGRWRTLPKRAGLLRCGKSCRLRWMNYLRPSVKRGHIASDEEDLILRLHRLLGNRWSLIAGRLPGRTDNEIKNYWNTHLRKKLMSQGIDPRTHKPLDLNKIETSASSGEAHHRLVPSSPPDPMSTVVDGTICTDDYHGRRLYNHQIQTYKTVDDNDHNGDKNVSNNCDDDVLSSFLNSLINEDPFNSSSEQVQQHDHDNLAGDVAGIK